MESTVHTKILSYTRLKNTVNGNSRWELLTDDGVFRTRPDSHLALTMNSGSYRDEHQGVLVKLTTTHSPRRHPCDRPWRYVTEIEKATHNA